MELLDKFIILTLLFSLTSAKTYYYEYHYPHRNFQWNVRHPQPPFSFEGGWPMGPFGFYPYPPASNEENFSDYPYQQEILVQSLNKALTKLNMLLAPISNSNQQEMTSFPPNTPPEVLVEALNKAIDRLGVLLASQQMSVNKEIVTEAQTEQVMSVNTETMTEGQIESMTTVTEGQKEPMIVTIEPNKIYENANSAIDDLNKLFSNLPEELKPRPNQNNNNNVIKPVIMNPPPFVSTIVSKTTAGPLFTSDVLENKATPAPSVPNIISNSGISTENNLFTSSELENNVVTSSSVPSDNVETTTLVSRNDTDVTTENLEIPIEGVTIDNDISTTPSFPDIDIRWGEKNETKKAEIRQDIVFPDDDDDDDTPFIDLSSRFKRNQTSTTLNPQLILTYKPSRPPFHADVFPPNPTAKPQTISNIQSQQPTQNRPFVSNVVELADRLQTTTTSTQNPQLILTYKPSRPPFHADVFPPNPTVKPQTNLEFGTSEQSNQNKPIGNVDLVDRNQQTTTQNPQLILTYKPSRPPFHADIFPPNPTPKPDPNLQSQTNVNPPNSNDFVDRFSPTTENIVSTTKNSKPYYPTPYYSSPINLEYKPTRPFYAPNPIFYPSPGKIPPGTPWPASSTERTN